jgi:hypothetical protein
MGSKTVSRKGTETEVIGNPHIVCARWMRVIGRDDE